MSETEALLSTKCIFCNQC